MAEYIEREAVVSLIQQYADGDVKVEETFLLTDLIGDITDIPAADVQPVKRGRWEKNNFINWRACSICGYRIDVIYADRAKYCPNCGADMRGEDNAESN